MPSLAKSTSPTTLSAASAASRSISTFSIISRRNSSPALLKASAQPPDSRNLLDTKLDRQS